MFTKAILFGAPVALLMSTTALCALTADEVWADLQGLASGNGGEIKAATQVAGDGVITLNGVTIGPAGGPAAITIAEMSIEEQDDGSVAFFPEDIKIAADAGTTASVEQNGLAISVFEDEGGLGYGIYADMLKVAFDTTTGTGETTSRTAGSVLFEALDGTYGRGTGEMTLDMVAKRLAYDITQVDPAAMVDSTSTSDSSDIELSGTLTIPEGVDLMTLDAPGAFEAALGKGMAASLAMTSGASKGTADERGPMMPLKATFEGGASQFDMNMDKTSLMIDTSASGLKGEIVPPGMPMPMPVSLDSLAMTYTMPVSAPEGGDYLVKLNLGNLVLGESVWGLFDPGAALPRDPINLALDLGGQAKLDLLAMAAASNGGMTQVAEPEPISLDIRQLAVNVAGAALSGTGAFTFDNSMLAAGGPPMPIGTANLRLEGGNKLIDGLIATGLLKEEDAMGARMMMAMFGKPEGDDVLTSQIEAKQGGSIFVNGQQIQ